MLSQIVNFRGVLALILASLTLVGCADSSRYSAPSTATSDPLTQMDSLGVPSSLTATTTTTTSVTLSWTPVTGATGYIIESKATDGTADFAQIAQIGNISTYTNTTLNYGWKYTYEVIALNSVGSSSPSSPVTIQVLGNGAIAVASGTPVPIPLPPSTPTGLKATSTTSTTVTLSWTPVTGATGYIVESKATKGTGAFVQIAQVGNVTTYTHTGLNKGWFYSYAVVAITSAGDSSPSSPVSIQVLGNKASAVASGTPIPLALPPSAPTNLKTTSTTTTSVTLSWTTVTAATEYIIESKATNGAAGFTQIAQVGNVSTYTNTGLNKGWYYTYEVIAVNSAGNSSPSSSVAIQVLGESTPSPTPTTAPEFTATPSPVPNPAPVTSSTSVPLDCANSSQKTLCNYVESNMKMKSAPATPSTACMNPTNTVSANPSNFVSVVNSVKSGQSVLFAPGTYNIPGSINLISNVNYCGQGGDSTKVIFNYSNDFAFVNNSGNNITIDGFTINGSGIESGMVSSSFPNNLYIQHMVIQNVKAYNPTNINSGTGIIIGYGSNVTITQNYFYNNNAALRIWQPVGNVLITDNRFTQSLWDDIAAGNNPATESGTLRIARNGFVDSHRISMEMYVPKLSSLLIEDNAVVYSNPWAYFTGEDSGPMGISLPFAPNNVNIRNNWLFGPASNYAAASNAPPMGIETYGPMQISGNVLQYWQTAFLESAGAPSMSVTNNSVCSVTTVQGADGGFTGYAGIFTNNGCVQNSQGYALP